MEPQLLLKLVHALGGPIRGPTSHEPSLLSVGTVASEKEGLFQKCV